MKGEIWGARDLENRDVVIKPVSYGARSTNELQILKYLNSDALRADKANTTVPVVEFLEYSGWTFAITQRWNDSVIPEFVDIGEVLEWAVQLIAAVAFLHRNRIAHLDISHENFLMNYWGVFPPERDRGTKPPKLRKNFAVKYALIDFGYSVQLPPDLDEPSRRGVWPVPREQSAPETKTGAPFDPFAADVYQAGRTIYGWCKKFIVHVPGVLAVLQDMTCDRPEDRLSAADAHARMLAAQLGIAQSTKAIEVPMLLLEEFDPVPH